MFGASRWGNAVPPVSLQQLLHKVSISRGVLVLGLKGMKFVSMAKGSFLLVNRHRMSGNCPRGRVNQCAGVRRWCPMEYYTYSGPDMCVFCCTDETKYCLLSCAIQRHLRRPERPIHAALPKAGHASPLHKGARTRSVVFVTPNVAFLKQRNSGLAVITTIFRSTTFVVLSCTEPGEWSLGTAP